MTRTILLSLAVIAALAMAVDGAEPPQPIDPAKVLAEAQKKLLAKFDLDKNGVLSDDEKLKALEELQKEGLLPGAGLAPGAVAGAEDLLKKFDTNRDGKLSGDERLAAAMAMQRAQRGRRGPAYGPGFGGVGPAGGAAVRGSGVPGTAAPAGDSEKPGKKVNPLVKRYDLDGDGKLNEAEKAALQADRGKTKSKDKKKTDKKAE